MQTASENAEAQRPSSATAPTNHPQQESSGNSRCEFLPSDRTPIGVVPLQPPSSEPTIQEADIPSGGNGSTMPNQTFTFNDSNINMDAMGTIVKEALRQLGVSDINIAKTSRRATRTSKSKAIKAQQQSMSREADVAWKVCDKCLDYFRPQ